VTVEFISFSSNIRAGRFPIEKKNIERDMENRPNDTILFNEKVGSFCKTIMVINVPTKNTKKPNTVCIIIKFVSTTCINLSL
jgi:hypothetical protein